MNKRLLAAVVALLLLLSSTLAWAEEVTQLKGPQNHPYTPLRVDGFDGVLYAFNDSNGITQLRIYAKYDGKKGFFPAEITEEGVNITADAPVKETKKSFGKAKIAKEAQSPESGFVKSKYKNIFAMVNVFNKKEHVAYASYDGENFAYYPIGKNNQVEPGALAVDIDAMLQRSKKTVGKSYKMPKEYSKGFAKDVLLQLEGDNVVVAQTDLPHLDLDALATKTRRTTKKIGTTKKDAEELGGIELSNDSKLAASLANITANISVKKQFKTGEAVSVSSQVGGGSATLLLQVKDANGNNVASRKFKNGVGTINLTNLKEGKYIAISAVSNGNGNVGKDRKDFVVTANPTAPTTLTPEEKANDTYLSVSVSYNKTAVVNSYIDVLVTLNNVIGDNNYTVSVTGLGKDQSLQGKGQKNYSFKLPVQTTAEQRFTVQVLTQSGKNNYSNSFVVNAGGTEQVNPQPQPGIITPNSSTPSDGNTSGPGTSAPNTGISPDMDGPAGSGTGGDDGVIFGISGS